MHGCAAGVLVCRCTGVLVYRCRINEQMANLNNKTIMTVPEVQIPGPQLTTKSGQPIKIGTGTGTKWQWLKKGRDSDQQNHVLPVMVDYLVEAIENGFRHIDTAEIYTTHAEVAAAIKKSSVKREDLFIATKYNPGAPHHKADYGSLRESVDGALSDLGTDYIDLFLIHFPFFENDLSQGQTLASAWLDLMAAKRAGKVRHIGVSNFARSHLEEVMALAGKETWLYPEVNQIEFHPYLQDQSLGIRQFCHENTILLEAYGPLSPLFRMKKDGVDIEDHPLKHELPKLASKYAKTDAQILLRYTLQKGLLPITTSSKSQRQKEALAVYDFELSPDDVSLIDATGAAFSFRGFFHGKYD